MSFHDHKCFSSNKIRQKETTRSMIEEKTAKQKGIKKIRDKYIRIHTCFT